MDLDDCQRGPSDLPQVCQIAAMTVMNGTKCREAKKCNPLCAGCGGYDFLMLSYEPPAFEEQQECKCNASASANGERKMVVSRYQRRKEQSPRSPIFTEKPPKPEIKCDGCGRGKVTILRKSPMNMCARCIAREKNGQPLMGDIPTGQHAHKPKGVEPVAIEPQPEKKPHIMGNLHKDSYYLEIDAELYHLMEFEGLDAMDIKRLVKLLQADKLREVIKP
jgi:hypothetical protein